MEDEVILAAEEVIGTEEVAKAAQLLQQYKSGKAALDTRIVDNELWFRMRHWKNYKNKMMEDKPTPASGWLFNSIANKHADAMDNYPEPNVLPRAANDEETARALSSVLPVVLEQADYEKVYSDGWWRKLKQGTGVTGIFWDAAARGGIGDIAVRSVNLLMLYWEPGVEDIPSSPDFFSLSLEDTARLCAQYPQLKGRTASVLDVPRYIHDAGQDTSTKSVVVDWYYKRPDENGRMVLHYCKFCNGVVLYASQVCHLPYQVREYGVIDGGSTIRGPDKPLQAVAGVNDIVFHLFIALALDLYSARRRGHQIHEHQSGQLQAAHHNLHARPGIAPTGPGILLVGHRQRIHPQANEQLVTKPHSPVLPVDLPIRGVEYVVGHHLKGGEMPPAPPHRIQVI